jgi:hypothetical protein
VSNDLFGCIQFREHVKLVCTSAKEQGEQIAMALLHLLDIMEVISTLNLPGMSYSRLKTTPHPKSIYIALNIHASRL